MYVRELTRILRVILRTDPSRPRCGKRGPRSRANQKRSDATLLHCSCFFLWPLILSPFNAPSIAGFGGLARRGACRMRARSRTYRDIRQANPAEAEKHRAPRSFIARCVVGG